MKIILKYNEVKINGAEVQDDKAVRYYFGDKMEPEND